MGKDLDKETGENSWAYEGGELDAGSAYSSKKMKDIFVRFWRIS